ncbi:hypothetical protein [Streptobacillus felis]|nr:hypothetical protein [Streptobacillus felis]
MIVTKKIKEERVDLVIDNLNSSVESEKETLEYILKKMEIL